MVDVSAHINLSRCLHCQAAYPSLEIKWQCDTQDYRGQNLRHWRVYQCSYCGSLVTASARELKRQLMAHFPRRTAIKIDDPGRPIELEQAFDTLHTPSGAVQWAGSAVDAMLKTKGYIDGPLYERIKEASRDHLITAGMASWALQVRLGPNDLRPTELDDSIPSSEEAKMSVAFAQALATFLEISPAGILPGIGYGVEELNI